MPEESLPLSVEVRIDAACIAFEAAWKAAATVDRRPRIEDYLAAADEADRWPVLQELLRLELEYRRAEHLTPEDYARRFPAYRHLLGPWFDERSQVVGETADSEPASGGRGDTQDTQKDPLSSRPARRDSPPDADECAPIYLGTPLARPERNTVQTGTEDLPPITGYEILGELGRGGMGVVYRATDCVLGRQVVVKVLQEKYAADSGTARRFADEARITGQLQHPNIPAVHDLGVLPDGRPFLAMRLIKGDTLEDLLKRRADAAEGRGRFVAAFEQVCQAVAYAHAHDVIHRDLKPANVMVGPFGEVQVMDWGLAKVLGSRPSTATRR